MYTIDVRFQGICCFADPNDSSLPFKKRVLLPYDDRADNDPMKHIAFLEIAEEFVVSNTIQWSRRYQHNSSGVYFLRWDLRGHRITFENAVDSGFSTTDSFRYHVPRMRNDIFQELDNYARDECFRPFPPPTLIGGFADLTTGILAAGPLENVELAFRRDGVVDPTWVGRTAKFVDLRLNFASTVAVIALHDGKIQSTINVKSGGSVLIGDMRDKDIREETTVPDTPESFGLFYKLSREVVTNPPLPEVHTFVPIDSCSSTGWP